MIEVDISNVWGELALPDLLAMEKEVFDAHMKLTEDNEENAAPGWLRLPVREATEEILRIQKCAEQIRCDSEVCVVVDAGGSSLGARAALELLQGINRNSTCGEGEPQIYFSGNSVSTRQWNELMRLLEGKDFSVIVISKSGTDLESAIAFRSLRWMLERKYGTEEANGRIYAVTDPEWGALRQMAEKAGWETFSVPQNVGGRYSVLTAAGLLPMAVAGIDVMAVMNGAADAKEEYDLRSYENPVWLYAAVRNLLYHSGRKTELLASFEPGFRSFGSWWQQLFSGTEGVDLFPAVCVFPEEQYAAGQESRFETMLRFAPGGAEHIIGNDWNNLDGLNYLEGKTLDFVEEQAYLGILNAHVDAGIPVITMDCGAPDEHTLGELFYFMELSCAISAYALGVNPFDQTGAENYRRNLFSLLGKPDCET